MALPKPNATMRWNDDTEPMTEEQVRGCLINPIAAGVAGFPPIVPDEKWVAAVKLVIEQDGHEQFLVNLLAVLRETFAPENEGREPFGYKRM